VSPDDGAPAYRLALAPRFVLARPWPGRLERNGGVELDRGAGRAHPRDDWQPLDDGALAALVAEVPGRDGVLPPTHLGLLQLPERLRQAWWAQAERNGVLPGTGVGCDRVFSEMVAFLRFKRLPLPERASLEVAVSAPGLRSTRVGPDGALQGLGFGDRPVTADAPGQLPLGLVNLGDEASFVVLLEHPPVTLAARLEAIGDPAAGTLPPRALVERYLAAFPQQPVLRLRLDPGEGLWLSPLGVVHDGWTDGKRDLDVMLRVGA